MQRRTFLGGAAALSSLPVGATGTVAADSGGDSDPEADDGYDFFTSLELPELHDIDTSYSIRTYENDPNADIALSLGGEFGSVRMEMTSERAEELAEELLAAAQESQR